MSISRRAVLVGAATRASSRATSEERWPRVVAQLEDLARRFEGERKDPDARSYDGNAAPALVFKR
jgi:hypothetical protein